MIENTIQGNRISYSIAGIGLNVNQKNFPEWIPNPTSIVIEAQKEYGYYICYQKNQTTHSRNK